MEENKCKCGNKKSLRANLCRDCYDKSIRGEGHPSYKDGRTLKIYYCIENCGKKLKNIYAKRCHSCEMKKRYREGIIDYKNNNNPMFNVHRFGEESPNWKGGLPKCKKCGHELSNYLSKLCGKCCKEGKLNPHFGKVSHGKWSKYKGTWMRSSYEVAYAKYLDKNNIKWQYESKTFDLGNTTYTPDFYLPESDTYIEIKGYWRDDAKKKFNLFKKLYKNINLLILTEIHLKSLRLIK